MSSIVFVTWDGGGNLPPALAIAAELQDRGHDVRFLGHSGQASKIAEAELPFTVFATARPFSAQQRPGTLAILGVVSDRAMGRDVVADVDAHGADLVVVDCLLLGVMDELRKVGRPYVVLEHLFDHALRGLARGPLGKVLRLRGIRALPLIDAGTRRIVTTISELDHGHQDVIHVGPVVGGTPARPERPTVLVSLSTFYYPDQVGTWQRILDAVDVLDARVIATLGPIVDPARLRVPTGVELTRWIDHSQVMPQTTLVVCHGGHGTTIAALAHDIPVLILPLDNDSDQPYVGRAVEAAGAGRMLSRKSKPNQIRVAMEDLLTDGNYREAAARLGAAIRVQNGRTNGADQIESLLEDAVESDSNQYAERSA